MTGKETTGISFIIVNKDNLKDVKELNRQGGRILVVEPRSFFNENKAAELSMILFGHPLINKNDWLNSNRGSKKIGDVPWQTRWQEDRDYLLRLKPEKSCDAAVEICRSFFKSLIIGPYEFSIHFQSTCGMGPLPGQNELILYIPKGRKIAPALSYGLRQGICKMEGSEFLSQKSVTDKITDYIMQDLKTGEVYRKNVLAGMNADSMF